MKKRNKIIEEKMAEENSEGDIENEDKEMVEMGREKRQMIIKIPRKERD